MIARSEVVERIRERTGTRVVVVGSEEIVEDDGSVWVIVEGDGDVVAEATAHGIDANTVGEEGKNSWIGVGGSTGAEIGVVEEETERGTAGVDVGRSVEAAKEDVLVRSGSIVGVVVGIVANFATAIVESDIARDDEPVGKTAIDNGIASFIEHTFLLFERDL